ncbi:hypothetical protein BC827DRAFT_185837 [Russula dissimulans]|nr:hypothetical protein BC827DRAFT_185837 [Russula dissimulans]
MSAGVSTIMPGASQSVDLPRRETSSNTQSASTSRFGPSLEASPRCPVATIPSPQLPLAPPSTQPNQVSSGPSAIETVTILPTAPQPRVPSRLTDRATSDETRNRLLYEDDKVHPEWVEYIHLDGTTYYRHTSGRILTPDDVTQPRIRECLARLYSLTVSTLTEHDLLADLPQDFEIVAERMDPEVPAVFYFVSQSLRRVINYAYDCPCSPTSTGTHPQEECPNPKLRLERTLGTRFWTHLASYPMHITALPPHTEADFLKALTQGVNERILDERKSMFPYTDQQAQRFMQVYRDLKCVPYTHGRHSVLPVLAWHISRVMTKIESVRERYRYGTKDARLYRDVAIDAPTWRERLLDVLLFSLFFNSHRTYRDRLAGTRPKGHVYLPDFRELMSGLLVEWSDSNLLATVFLSYVSLARPNSLTVFAARV